jgi:hypothetical protein
MSSSHARYCGIVMDKRLAKRHKRQVSRAKERVKLSEPDLRTPEQIKAARDASRPAGTRGNARNAPIAAPQSRTAAPPGTGSGAKTDA